MLCDLRDPQGRLLLLHRLKDPNKDLYSPIGGKLDVETGESPAQCAQREIQEEAGVEIDIDRLRLVGMISERGYPAKAGSADGGRTNWLLFYYRVMGPVSFEPFEMREGRLEWIEPERVHDLPLPETDRSIIWPLVEAHGTDGFFAVHIDCEGARLQWRVEQSVGASKPFDATGEAPGGAG
ncbi:MAG: NUDIX domain-containing protein [Planctomycetota bacterium]